MDVFSLYGVAIESDIHLPEIEPVRSEPDVSITIEDRETRFSDPKKPEISVDEQTAQLSYPGIGQFHVRNGTTIIVDRVTDASDQGVRAVLMGPALGFLLYQRGYLVLHGSAIGRNGAAYVFVGSKGAGKSTTAGAFARRGDTVLCDDLTVIDVDDSDHRILPGLSHVKLADDHFGYEAFPTTESLEMVKQYYRVPETGGHPPDRIGALFLLEPGSELAVETPPASKAIWGLLEHLYLRQFTDELIVEHCFEQVTSLADQIPIRRLTRPNDIEALADLPKIIEDAQS